jgi:hypothetical protein
MRQNVDAHTSNQGEFTVMRTRISRTLAAVLAAASTLAPMPARAADSDGAPSSTGEGISAARNGFQLGLRTGFGLPLGLSSIFNGQLPIWVDAGYRINPNFYVGAYFQYGIAFVNKSDGCSSPGWSCSGSDIRFGANVHYHVLPAASFDPWVGLGFGYEFSNFFSSHEGTTARLGFKGFEFVNLQVGGDYRLSRAFGVGPFASFSIGQYDFATEIVPGPSAMLLWGDVMDKAIHEWLVLGLRGVYDL